MKSYKELIVWQKAMKFCKELYLITDKFPKNELYGLTSQLRRASVAIPSNIAEGQRRGHKAEYIQFIRIAFSSGAEVETQLLLSLDINYLSREDFEKLNILLDEIMRMLNKLLQVLSL